MMPSSSEKIAGEEAMQYLQLSLQALKNVALFSNFSDQEVACFQDVSQMRSYKKGKILYIEKDAANFFYIICDGWIKLFHTLPEGDEVIVDTLTTGQTVGESAIFEQGRHTSSAEVIEDVRLLVIPSSILKDQIYYNPAAAFAILSSMSRHYRRHYGEIALNAMQSAPQRIGRFLLRLCPKDKKTSITLHLPYEKTLIAHTLGMKRATFSRALNILRQQTGLRIQGTYVEIDSIDELMKFVYGSLAAWHLLRET
jgi:CRP-like cAMP-binding protein